MKLFKKVFWKIWKYLASEYLKFCAKKKAYIFRKGKKERIFVAKSGYKLEAVA